MAALILKETGATSELVVGDRGELSLWVGGQRVAGKGPDGFPTDEAVLTAIRAALA